MEMAVCSGGDQAPARKRERERHLSGVFCSARDPESLRPTPARKKPPVGVGGGTVQGDSSIRHPPTCLSRGGEADRAEEERVATTSAIRSGD